MAFFEYSISSVSQIPSLIANAALQVGWITGEVDNVVTLRNPNYYGSGQPGGLSCRISFNDTTSPYHSVEMRLRDGITNVGASATIRTPVTSPLGQPSAQNMVVPTKLYVISMLTPEPYIALVFEFGYNLYRHLYFGFMEKLGEYGGGEVISSSNGPIIRQRHTNSSATQYLVRTESNLLFAARSKIWTANTQGCVNVVSPDNAVPFRNFMDLGASVNGVNSATNGTQVLGGFGDGLNDVFVAKGQNSIAGAAVLTPVNLVIDRFGQQGVNYVPIGNPAGVRLINIENMEAQGQALIGTETWHTFAAIRKRNTTRITYEPGSNTSWPIEESSGQLGYAYRSE